MKFCLSIFISFLLITGVSYQNNSDRKIHFGNEILISEHLDLLQNKKIGIVTNHTSVLPNNVHLVDTLISLGIKIIALFSPEHGIRGDYAGGVMIESSVDERTHLPVYSLYGKVKKPTAGMLEGVDLLLFDIQNIGARFYTFNSTLYYSIEAAAENRIPIIILDRPNPLNGEFVAGPVIEPEFKSFIGVEELPIAHGMTIGELAKLFQERINLNGKNSQVKVIKIEGWSRKYNWNSIDREWISTSPNIPTFETALVYPGMCLIEGTNISEGRGTDNPFLTIGAPFVDSEEFIKKLKVLDNPGITLQPVTFKPETKTGKALSPKFEGITCNGISFDVKNENDFKPVKFGLNVIYTLLKMYPDNFKFIEKHFDLLAGTDKLRKELISGKTPEEIISGWDYDLEKFKLERKKYLLY